jgi:predicted GIY-YIG superfamily endonuclease
MWPWVVYILQCGDGTLYVGITNRLEVRLRAHASGKGARYTRGRGPLKLIYLEHAGERAGALRREHWIKKLCRSDKLKLAGVRAPLRT